MPVTRLPDLRPINPAAPPADQAAVGRANERALGRAVDLVAAGGVLALTGAGVSTDSGIPDYRGPGAVVRAPMTHGEFLSGPAAQQRYWARSHLGWRRMGAARPNRGHVALAALEMAGHLRHLITQNVDGLHQEAGSAGVTDLHGRIDEVVCLDCRRISPRAALHDRLSELNPSFGGGIDVRSAPDGDVELEDTDGFRIAGCATCGGVLKPNVVFFGDNVDRAVVGDCAGAVEAASCLLVAGSSLTVMSGFRFVRQAARRGIPVILINRGPTRADQLITCRIDDGCSPTLVGIAAHLGWPM